MNVEVLVQAGAIGLCFYLIYVDRQKDKEYNEMMGNHLHEDIESREKLTRALTKLEKAIKNNLKRG